MTGFVAAVIQHFAALDESVSMFLPLDAIVPPDYVVLQLGVLCELPVQTTYTKRRKSQGTTLLYQGCQHCYVRPFLLHSFSGQQQSSAAFSVPLPQVQLSFVPVYSFPPPFQ